MNRLAAEQSPYLLQHAANPVDWYPWGDEAFERARRDDKPIFLSIGYSTCHWCHVMEHESFENQGIARVLNDRFVSIKVDREERPDVDRVYMTFVQATTGSGGWPMSVWLTPDLRPFYGGTYYPPDSRWGRPGFLDVLVEISRAWRDERPAILQSAGQIVARLTELAGGRGESSSADAPGEAALASTLRQFKASFDRRRGGFGDAPKFPRPSELLFLLREHARTGDEAAREMVLTTLRAMALGGMRDHIGGGFHRYSVDGDWRVPHFEKMLYDQAQLVLAYLEAAQVSGDPFFAQIAEDTLQYVARDMTDDRGGFYSAEDADSVPPSAENASKQSTEAPSTEKSSTEDTEDAEAGSKDRSTEHVEGTEARPLENGSTEGSEQSENTHAQRKMEGAFYIWALDEVQALLGGDSVVFERRYGLLPDGNAPFDPQSEFTGKNLLYTARGIAEVASEVQRTPEDVAGALTRARVTLFHARLKRPRPHLDDKVLTSWNGLMIAAFARASRVLSDGRALGTGDAPRRWHLEAAANAASFLHDTLWDAGRATLLRRYRSGTASIEGYAEDYAYLVFGLLELFQAGGDPRWLEWALTLQQRQDDLFWDASEAGWFSTTGRDPSVLLRMKEEYDGAEPSASAVGAWNLLTIARLTGQSTCEARAREVFRAFAGRLDSQGRGLPMLAAALSASLAPPEQTVVVGSSGDEATAVLWRAANQHYRPFATVVPLEPGTRQAIAAHMPWVAAMTMVDERPAAYRCREFVCAAPTTDPHTL